MFPRSSYFNDWRLCATSFFGCSDCLASHIDQCFARNFNEEWYSGPTIYFHSNSDWTSK